jgi:hypothetical protein
MPQMHEPHGREASNHQGDLPVDVNDLILAMSDDEIAKLFEYFIVSTVMRITR